MLNDNALFKEKFGIEFNDLEHIGTVLRDACVYYVHKPSKTFFYKNRSDGTFSKVYKDQHKRALVHTLLIWTPTEPYLQGM